MVPNILPHFQVCSCGQHGRVVFQDGRTSGEMFSKEEALIDLQNATLVCRFQSVEIFPTDAVRALIEEIDASTLPKYKSQVTDYKRKVFNTWNTAKLFQPALDPDQLHGVETSIWHYRAGD